MSCLLPTQDYSTSNNKMSTKKVHPAERVITRENVTEPKSSSITTEQRQNSEKSPQKNGPTSPSRNSIT